MAYVAFRVDRQVIENKGHGITGVSEEEVKEVIHHGENLLKPSVYGYNLHWWKHEYVPCEIVEKKVEPGEKGIVLTFKRIDENGVTNIYKAEGVE